MARHDRTPRFSALRLLARLPALLRACFYVVTIGAALAAVLATSAPGEEGQGLMQISWLLLMAGFVLFAMMVVAHFVAAQRLQRARDRAQADPPAVSTEAAAHAVERRHWP